MIIEKTVFIKGKTFVASLWVVSVCFTLQRWHYKSSHIYHEIHKDWEHLEYRGFNHSIPCILSHPITTFMFLYFLLSSFFMFCLLRRRKTLVSIFSIIQWILCFHTESFYFLILNPPSHPKSDVTNDPSDQRSPPAKSVTPKKGNFNFMPRPPPLTKWQMEWFNGSFSD